MKNLDKIVDKIGKSIDEKDKVREQALKYSREIIIGCRKGIQCIHQKLMKEAKKHIKKSSETLSALNDLTEGHADLYHTGFVENAGQEYVEAVCLFNIRNGKELPDPDTTQTTYSAYLLGLCDVVGELRRSALDSILTGESAEANDYLKLMDEIYDAILQFDYPSALVRIKRKQDMVRGLIEKTRGELAVASCERRIEYHTDEFRGILDKMNGDKKKTSDKKKDSDLNIDKVW